MRFDRVIVVDWSAASTPGPKRPAPDRCWLAWADAEAQASARPEPEYFRTRGACEARVHELCESCAGSVLLALDVAFGYPSDLHHHAVLPSGRALCATLHDLIDDQPDGRNNRFAVAAELNREIRRHTGCELGPFWGHPPNWNTSGLSFTKPVAHGCQEFRAIERLLQTHGMRPHSPWKLAGAGAVGSQSLLGLPMVHRLLLAFGARGVLWPFEPVHEAGSAAATQIVIAECWPSLADETTHQHPIKDARQVLALCEEFCGANHTETLLQTSHPDAATEGWILGATQAIRSR